MCFSVMLLNKAIVWNVVSVMLLNKAMVWNVFSVIYFCITRLQGMSLSYALFKPVGIVQIEISLGFA
jgi:hypothetical protein